ncbi:MAG: taurine ABC transporter ATP-binding protein [Hyphomicrobiaceae bacterium]
MSNLDIDNVSVVFPAGSHSGEVTALQSVRLDISRGEFVVVLGASGCGKTTLLNLLAGFIAPSHGEIRLNGHAVIGPGPDRAVVFQKHALLPWLNVIDNVAFGLKLRGEAKAHRHEIARGYLKQLGLESFERHPVYQLSGGMQQRVGIARALANDPEILLMDEPLGALDALTREKAQELILNVWQRTGKMVFFITHSVEEALFMGTRLIVMSPRPGRITHTFDIDFGRRFLAQGDARAVKSSRDFIKLREEVLGIIFGDEEAGGDDN